jgi:hypothetical protein
VENEVLAAVAALFSTLGILISGAVALMKRMRQYALATLALGLLSGIIGSAAGAPYSFKTEYVMWFMVYTAPGLAGFGILACILYQLQLRRRPGVST